MAVQRRSLLISGAVAGAVPALAEARPPVGAGSARLGRPIVMRQPAVAASVGFAAGAGPARAALIDLPADVAAVLYGPRSQAWRTAGRAVYGLTTADVWFCIVQALGDAGLRPVRRESHAPDLSLEAAAESGRAARAQARDASAWHPVAALAPETPGDALVSWVLVPRQALVPTA